MRTWRTWRRRLKADLNKRADFARIHTAPRGSQDVPDDLETRLVVLGSDAPYSRDAGNKAEATAKAILETRGTAPRLYRNTLVFLAADQTRLQDFDEAVRKYLAWSSILKDKAELNLTASQVTQAETQHTSADQTVNVRLPETWQWLLTPTQGAPTSPVTWQAARLTGQDSLAARAAKKLKADEALIGSYGGTLLRMEMDKVPLWRDDHVAVKQLVEDFARYLYLPRLTGPRVLCDAMQAGVASLTWQLETYAYAEGYDEAANRYRGLTAARQLTIIPEDAGLLVRPEVAQRQLDAEEVARRAAAAAAATTSTVTTTGDTTTSQGPGGGTTVRSVPPTEPEPARLPRRFYGTVDLDPSRVGRDAGRIAEEVLAHLLSQPGATVRVTLEIDATVPEGANERVVRTVTENARTLKFTSQGFEVE